MDEEDLNNQVGENSSNMHEELALGLQVAQFNLSGKSSSDSESSDTEKTKPFVPKQTSRNGPVEDDYREFLAFNLGPRIDKPVEDILVCEGSTLSQSTMLEPLDNTDSRRKNDYAEDRSSGRTKKTPNNKKKNRKQQNFTELQKANYSELQQQKAGRGELHSPECEQLESQYFQTQMLSLHDDTSSGMMVEDKFPTDELAESYLGASMKFKSVAQMKQEFGFLPPSGPQDPSGPKPGCTCAKSKCIKMYCTCFSFGRACTSDCLCVDCRNTPAHREQTLDNQLTEAQLKNREGDICCNCRWSQCENSYCSCTKNSKGCGPSCKCYNCKNVFGSRKKGS